VAERFEGDFICFLIFGFDIKHDKVFLEQTVASDTSITEATGVRVYYLQKSSQFQNHTSKFKYYHYVCLYILFNCLFK